MKICISTGFIGDELKKHFSKKYKVVQVKRSDFYDKKILEKKLENTDILINLAGENIARRWSKEYKKKLLTSRVESTKALLECFKKYKPKLFISTSAIGIYDTKNTHTEESQKFTDTYLADIAKAWEDEALKAKDFNVRTIILRLGVVLSSKNGALAKMLPAFKLNLGGKIGDGKQAFSWIYIKDLINIYEYLSLTEKKFEGIFNAVSPNPISNEEFTKVLSKVLNKFSFFTIPAFILKLILGEGSLVLLEGQKVLPQRLIKEGFNFKYPLLEDALKDSLKN